MGLAGTPEYSNPIFPVLDGADATYSPVSNSNAITKHKSPWSHSSIPSVFPTVKKKDTSNL
jgi:hypothetical protein